MNRGRNSGAIAPQHLEGSDISPEWFQTTIGEQATLQRGFDITKAEQRAGKVPVVSSGGISSYHDTAAMKGPGVVLGRKGVVGSVFYIPDDFWAHDTTLWVKDFHGNNPRFVYYFFRSIASRLSGLDVGSANPTLNRNHVHPIPIKWATRQKQDEIVGILAALDDKIALLRTTNATLESIAQALFKSWFVDFDPVRAKAEGRDPEGVPPEVAELFPCEFEESELGAIPKGWRVSSLDKHLDVVRGLSYKGSGLAEPDDTDAIPMHNLNSVLEGGGYKYAGLKFYKGERRPKHEIKAGDIIVANTEQGHDHLLIGYPAVVPVTPHRCELFSHHLYRVRALPGSPLNNLFIYRLLMTPVVREQVVGCSNGTTVNMLKADGLAIPKFICPPKELAAAFEQAVAPFHAQQEDNITQTTSLAVLRDTLLPRLVSGKLAITSKGPLQVTS